jgi:hypothetical protein
VYQIYAFILEALPFSVLSNLACGICGPAGDTSVDEVSQNNERQCQSNHWAPSFQLTSNIDSHVTSQMLVWIVALEIGFAGINVSFISLVCVIIGSVLGHDITSYFFFGLS